MASVRPSDGIGDRLSKYRRLAGITARELAEQAGLGLTRAIITNIENGRKTDITVDQLIALSTVLGVPPVVLAVPVDRPFVFVRLTDNPKTGRVERQAYQAANRFMSGETAAENPAGYVAAELVRGIKQLRPAQQALREAKLGHADPAIVAELEQQMDDLSRTLQRLGADLTKHEYDGK